MKVQSLGFKGRSGVGCNLEGDVTGFKGQGGGGGEGEVGAHDTEFDCTCVVWGWDWQRGLRVRLEA